MPSLIVEGSMRRHRETRESVIAGADWSEIPIIQDVGWNEFDHLAMLDRLPAPFGQREPNRAEFQEWFVRAAARWTSGEYDDEYEETFTAFAGRVDEALDRVVSSVGSNETALVVTSGGPVSWSTTSLIAGSGAPPTRAALWNQLNKVVVNSSISKVVAGSRGATLVSFNEHSHLEGERLTYR